MTALIWYQSFMTYMFGWARNSYLFLLENFHRHDQDQEVQSKIATIEDLHSRLKLNIDNIQQLNQQVPNFWITFILENVNIEFSPALYITCYNNLLDNFYFGGILTPKAPVTLISFN